jgi:CHAT domain-containing protein
LLVEAFDALAQLYEDQQRFTDAALLNVEGLAHLAHLDARTAAALGIKLEWRQGRLSRQAEQPPAALAAYQRAADLLEMIRQALPIEYEDGRSTYSALIEPLHLGLVELLLGMADAQTPPLRSAYLRKARDVIELTRQAEMQDFLGDRCTVESVQGSDATLPADTAVLYIVLLQDHIELLLETPQGLERRHLDVGSKVVRTTAQDFAEQLRNGADEYPGNSRQLYDWLIRPLEDVLSSNQTRTLVIVPHDTLRLVAMAALHDGKQFLVEKYAVVSATGMSMIQTGRPQRRIMQSLIAGLSAPGPVVEKLSAQLINQGLKAETQRKPSARSMTNTVTSMRSIRASETLRESLSLPGVKEEVMAVGNTLNAKRLLNEGFTVDNFYREADGGEYRILHIASHGMFGGSAESSYILAYDDLLTLDGLQDLLKSDSFRKNPIEILSLSACQTAEGNERAPLGISGAAIKARARSVLGTLWPVEDISARTLMDRFYVGLSQKSLSKGEALRQAQISLMQVPQYSHPLFWAPFTLIGNWQ